MKLKNIPTTYAGVEFRSRLEARWALFFDLIRLPWQYEAEGFQVPSGWYVPDFFLPTVRGGMWFEIKWERPNALESAFCGELCAMTEKDVGLQHGPFPQSCAMIESGSAAVWDFYVAESGPRDGERIVCWDCDHRFCLCPKCGKIGFEFEGRGERICRRACGIETDDGANGDDPRLERAYQEAWAHRFW